MPISTTASQATSPNLHAPTAHRGGTAFVPPRRARRRGKAPTPSLFPTVPRHRDLEPATFATGPAAGLVGIARLAAASPRSEAKRGTEYFLLPVRSILNRCDSDRVPFAWTVNPYRGCEFGCRYCYARYTHEYMELDGAPPMRRIPTAAKSRSALRGSARSTDSARGLMNRTDSPATAGEPGVPRSSR